LFFNLELGCNNPPQKRRLVREAHRQLDLGVANGTPLRKELHQDGKRSELTVWEIIEISLPFSSTLKDFC
jgi:hypothetical protein